MNFSSRRYSSENSKSVLVKNKYFGILDGLRGFAALSVVLFHFTGGPSVGGALPKLPNYFLEEYFSWGYMGVEVFFVISGFVIPYSLWNADYSLYKIIPYLGKRILRICPPAYLSLLLLLIQWFFIDYVLRHDNNRLGVVTLKQILDNITFLAPFTGSAWINGVFWTLAIEFQFYLIIGFLYKQLFRSHIIFFLLLSALFDGMQYLPNVPTDNFFRFSLFFALGGVTLLFQQQRIAIKLFLSIVLLFTVVLVFHFGFWLALFGAATALIIAFVKIEHNILRWLGKISYSLYLTHLLAGAMAEFILVKLFHPSSLEMICLAIAGCILFAIAFAYGFYRLVELPFHRLAQRLAS